jgi:predicted Zn-dependent peptidase
MSSGLSQTRDASNWWFGAQVSDKNAVPLFDIMNQELARVLEGDLDLEEIEAAKQYSLGRFQRSGQTVGGISSGYSSRYFFDEVIEDYYRIPERIQAVNRDQIVTIANSLFQDEVWGLGILGDCGMSFSEELRSRLATLWGK